MTDEHIIGNLSELLRVRIVADPDYESNGNFLDDQVDADDDACDDI